MSAFRVRRAVHNLRSVRQPSVIIWAVGEPDSVQEEKIVGTVPSAKSSKGTRWVIRSRVGFSNNSRLHTDSVNLETARVACRHQTESMMPGLPDPADRPTS